MTDNQSLGDIAIPAAVYVRCPLVEFQLSPASGCDGCTHFRGLTERLRSANTTQQMLEADANLFRKTFAVRCAWPTDRELSSIAKRAEK